jgi:hypothetical protein
LRRNKALDPMALACMRLRRSTLRSTGQRRDWVSQNGYQERINRSLTDKASEKSNNIPPARHANRIFSIGSFKPNNA